MTPSTERVGSAEKLRSKNRWLTTPSTLAVLSGVAIICTYVWVAVEFPPGSRLSLFVVVGLVCVVLNFVADGVEQRRLAPLTDLGLGRVPATAANLEAAARVVVRAPDVTFWVMLVFVSAGAVIIAGLWSFVARVPVTMVARIGFIGLTIAPITAVLGNLVLLPRARAVQRLLVEAGLPLDALARAQPAGFELRRRLVVYACIAVLTPAVLIVDLIVSRTSLLLDLAVTGTQAPGSELLPIAVLGFTVVVTVAACAWLSGSTLGQPLRELAQRTEKLARGEYGEATIIPAEFETMAATLAIAAMEHHLVGAIRQLEDAAQGITGASGELQAGVDLHQRGAEQQMAALAATTATTEELARSARQIATNAQMVSELAHQTLESARAGKTSAAAFTGAMQEVRGGNQAIADSVVRLNKRVQQVGKIVEFIDGIADRSDLLALNAELEGNKAGEVGRGFSLVAAEMRRLAESVMVSTREISRLIEEIRDATNAAVMATEAGVKATDAGSALAQQVSDGLAQIVEFANLTADAVQSISTGTVQQQAGTDQLVSAMEDILASTRKGVDASAEMSRANGQLDGLSRELSGSVKRFKGAA